MNLPAYQPPDPSRAGVAAGLAPLLVLLGFVAVVLRWMDPDTGLAALLACALWVAYEMHEYQRGIDRYNADYVRCHLAWRSAATLESMAHAGQLPEPTRCFVRQYLASGCEWQRDRPQL
jgi:hypothetical protein